MNIKFYSLGIFVLFLLFGCSEKPAEKLELPKDVSVIKAEEINVPFKKEIIGDVVPEEQIELKARVTGFLEKVDFEWGSIVKKGQTLFEIEKNQYKADLKKALSELEDSIAIKNNADKDYNRKETLYYKRAVSEEDYDNAKMYRGESDAKVKSAEARVEQAKLNLSYATIKAPFTGKIDKPKYTAGNLVGPDSGTLATLIKLDPIQVEFNPDEKLYLEKNPGEKQRKNVEVKLFLADSKIYKYPGKITYTDNKVDKETGTIKFRATFPNPDYTLLPGQYVNVILKREMKQNSIVIPQKCIMNGQIGQYVYIVNNDNKIETRKIKTGTEFGTDVVIMDGLKAGDCVVSENLHQIADGQIVKPVFTK